MSNYTMELRHICEHYAGLTPEEIMFASPETIISAAREHVFDFQYPLYDPEHKEELESKIIYHFYMREISAETPALWKLFLARTMREIMPYYNQLYHSADLEYNPLHDVDIHRTHAGHASGISGSSSSRNGTTAGTGAVTVQESGTNANARTEARSVDETVNTTGSSDGRGTSSKATHTETETDTSSHATGEKDSTAQYSDEDTNRNAFSATPESTINGVEGVGGNADQNVSADFWLTDYRKIHDYKHGDSSASEDTENSETGHSESTGDQTENGSTTDHKEDTGRAVTDRDESATINDSGTTTLARNESSNTTGSSSDNSTGSANFQNADDWEETVTGKQGASSYSAMILEYRETILNIDMMIINELESCFMQIY